MASELIKKHLEKLKNQKKFDEGFIDILIEANERGEDGTNTADQILDVVKKRYVEDKKNQS